MKKYSFLWNSTLFYLIDLPRPNLGDLSDLKSTRIKLKRQRNPNILGYNYHELADLDKVEVELEPDKKGLILKHREYTVSSRVSIRRPFCPSSLPHHKKVLWRTSRSTQRCPGVKWFVRRYCLSNLASLSSGDSCSLFVLLWLAPVVPALPPWHADSCWIQRVKVYIPSSLTWLWQGIIGGKFRKKKMSEFISRKLTQFIWKSCYCSTFQKYLDWSIDSYQSLDILRAYLQRRLLFQLFEDCIKIHFMFW